MDTATNLILIISIGGTLLLFNAILIGVILLAQRKVAAAQGWPSTSGTVLTSALEQRLSSDNSGYVSYPVVHYSYEVKGERLEGNRITPGLAWGGSGAQKVIERYPVGARVSVYYDPHNPSEALLERQAPPYVMWLWTAVIVLDLFLCGIGAVIWWAVSQ